MRKIILIAAIISIATISIASANIDIDTQCGTDGFEFCIIYTNGNGGAYGNDYDHFYNLACPACWDELGNRNIYYIKTYFSGFYPGYNYTNVSKIHTHGMGSSTYTWEQRIYFETLAHVLSRDGSIHFSKYYLTKGCQVNNNCPPFGTAMD